MPMQVSYAYSFAFRIKKIIISFFIDIFLYRMGTLIPNFQHITYRIFGIELLVELNSIHK
jgi:hypothetical protein